jgi:hypothetical protein
VSGGIDRIQTEKEQALLTQVQSAQSYARASSEAMLNQRVSFDEVHNENEALRIALAHTVTDAHSILQTVPVDAPSHSDRVVSLLTEQAEAVLLALGRAMTHVHDAVQLQQVSNQRYEDLEAEFTRFKAETEHKEEEWFDVLQATEADITLMEQNYQTVMASNTALQAGETDLKEKLQLLQTAHLELEKSHAKLIDSSDLTIQDLNLQLSVASAASSAASQNATVIGDSVVLSPLVQLVHQLREDLNQARHVARRDQRKIRKLEMDLNGALEETAATAARAETHKTHIKAYHDGRLDASFFIKECDELRRDRDQILLAAGMSDGVSAAQASEISELLHRVAALDKEVASLQDLVVRTHTLAENKLGTQQRVAVVTAAPQDCSDGAAGFTALENVGSVSRDQDVQTTQVMSSCDDVSVAISVGPGAGKGLKLLLEEEEEEKRAISSANAIAHADQCEIVASDVIDCTPSTTADVAAVAVAAVALAGAISPASIAKDPKATQL